mmetsp:Transcript_27663/g.66652  ORF Transcript_27663/g.66652 Transcript_27663/m.66652 type:complete len:202 (-) Transcript_27663:81-686(-)
MPQTKRVTNNPFHLLSKIFDLHLPYLATTLHLQIELALWICTLLLTGASSVVLYKRSYLHTTGDWAFLTWVGVWLGRHFVMRLACTMTWADPPSSASSSSSSSAKRTRSLLPEEFLGDEKVKLLGRTLGTRRSSGAEAIIDIVVVCFYIAGCENKRWRENSMLCRSCAISSHDRYIISIYGDEETTIICSLSVKCKSKLCS